MRLYYSQARSFRTSGFLVVRGTKEVMGRIVGQTKQSAGQRAAIYARVSDKSQAEEDKTSTAEQINEMEAYCERTGLTIAARYQEVGRGWSKKRPEFQRMLADAGRGLFDTIVCWKSDRLSRGMYPAAALMEVEAHQIRLEAVMDAIAMKTFGLMAAIGKIGLTTSGKDPLLPADGLLHSYRIGDDGRRTSHSLYHRPQVSYPESEAPEPASFERESVAVASKVFW